VAAAAARRRWQQGGGGSMATVQRTVRRRRQAEALTINNQLKVATAAATRHYDANNALLGIFALAYFGNGDVCLAYCVLLSFQRFFN
jgi:hypothetical protein